MPKALPTYLLTGLVLLSGFRPQLIAQSTPCAPPAALIAPDDPAYPDAVDLAKHLGDHGFVVQCIFPTKFGSIFRVLENGVEHSTIEGEADFHTNFGDIDVVFVPKPQTFADFKITERRKGGGYLYRFTGAPRVWAGDQFKFGTAHRQSFLKHENQLLLVSYDGDLRARLEDALHLRP